VGMWRHALRAHPHSELGSLRQAPCRTGSLLEILRTELIIKEIVTFLRWARWESRLLEGINDPPGKP
jgi:hypothetical protein